MSDAYSQERKVRERRISGEKWTMAFTLRLAFADAHLQSTLKANDAISATTDNVSARVNGLVAALPTGGGRIVISEGTGLVS